MLVGDPRVLVGFLVIALFMVLRCGVMGPGGMFVMLGCFTVRFVCHTAPLI